MTAPVSQVLSEAAERIRQRVAYEASCWIDPPRDHAKAVVGLNDLTLLLASWDAGQTALTLARPVVEADKAMGAEYADADWEGMAHIALEAIAAALAKEQGR